MDWRFDPRHLRTLESIVRLGSFAAAGQELGYTQSAVSQQIAELERRVGARVVGRRPVRLTEAGRVLVQAETEITTSMSRASTELSALADGATGQVRLGAFISAAAAVAPPALARLSASHPGVHLSLHELEQSTIFSALLRGEVDLAITFDYPNTPAPVPEGIRREHLVDDPLRVVLPADHPLAGAATVAPADVPVDSWINTTADAAPGAPPGSNDERGPGPRVAFEGQDFRTALNLVAAGLGVALLPQLALLQPPPGVAIRPMRRPGTLRRLHLARLDTDGVSTSIRRLETYLRQAAEQLFQDAAPPVQ